MFIYALPAVFAVFIFCGAASLLYILEKPELQAKKRAGALSEIGGRDTGPEEKSKARRGKKKTEKLKFAALQKLLHNLENELYDIGIQISVSNFVLLWVLAAIGLPLILLFFGIGEYIAMGLAVVIAMAPILYVRTRRSSRRQKIEAQLIDAIGIMCSAMKAGHSFQSSLNSIAAEMEAPISDEFGRVYRETLHGMSVEESLRRMVDRVGSDELDMLATAVAIQREIGGNMSEILANISGTIQSRMSMRKEIKTRTSSGRVSGYIVGGLPIVLLIAINIANPDYCSPMFSTSLGKIMLGAGAGLEMIGFLVIKKIISVKY